MGKAFATNRYHPQRLGDYAKPEDKGEMGKAFATSNSLTYVGFSFKKAPPVKMGKALATHHCAIVPLRRCVIV